jgi:ATP-dependent DNA ligase
MEAELTSKLPAGEGWIYEPKWDGFRCLAFRDGERVELRSKAGKPLGRYFPEIVRQLAALEPARFVLDGELVVPVDGALDFDRLLQRIHPAASRVKKLAEESPARFILFDLLVDATGKDLTGRAFAKRRAALQEFAKRYLAGHAAFQLSPSTHDAEEARRWLAGELGGLDGVMAKRADAAYASGERTAMKKVKRARTADCVVGGFRWVKAGDAVASLLLGLYDAEGKLDHVGFCSALNAAVRAEATAKLLPLRGGTGFTGRAPGGPSRWRTEGAGEFESLRPELVVEVGYDHFAGGRFRHGTKFVRWRPDKEPGACRIEQVEKEGRTALGLL